MCEYLLGDFTNSDLDQQENFLLLSDSEEICLIYLISCSASVFEDRVESDGILIRFILRIVAKYARNHDCMLAVLGIIDGISMNSFIEHAKVSEFQELFQVLSGVYLRLPFLMCFNLRNRIAESLNRFCSHEQDTSRKESAIQTINPVIWNANRCMNLFIESMYVSLTDALKNLDDYKNVNALGQYDIVHYQDIAKIMSQIYLAMNNSTEFRYGGSQVSENHQIMNCVLEHSLHLLTLAVEDVENESTLIFVASEMCSCALHMMKLEAAFFVSKLRERSTEAQSDMLVKINRLVDFCEVIVSSKDGIGMNGIRFPIQLRYDSVRVLISMYLLLNSQITQGFADFKRQPHDIVQAETFRVICKVIQLSYEGNWTNFMQNRSEVARMFQHNVTEDISCLLRLAKDGIYEISYAHPILKWIGVEPRISSMILGNTLTDVLKHWVKSYFDKIPKLINDYGVDNGQNQIRLCTESILKLCYETLLSSVFMFITGQTNVRSICLIVETISSNIKGWALLQKETISLRLLLGDGICRLLERSVSQCVLLIGNWKNTSTQSRLRDSSFFNDNSWMGTMETIQPTLMKVNEIWIAWAEFARGIQNLAGVAKTKEYKAI